MLTLFTAQSRTALLSHPRGQWFELAPGPDDGRHWSADGAFFLADEWMEVGEPIVADRLPGYDNCGRTCVDAVAWQAALAYLDSLCARLQRVVEPTMLHIEASELPLRLLRRVEGSFPAARGELVRDLEALALWCRATLRRWGAITVIGL